MQENPVVKQEKFYSCPPLFPSQITSTEQCVRGGRGGREGGGDVLVRVLMRVVDNRPRWVQATESFTTSFGVDMSVKESDCQRGSQADPLQW